MISAATQAADEIEPLDIEFLDYLANMEGDDDDWTLLAIERPRASSEQPASETVTREANEEAAQTAVERR